MRLLITGSKGQLGNEIVRCLEMMEAEIGPIPGEYRGAERDAVDRDELDIADEAAVNAWFEKRRYDIVVNCAAVTDVDGCETDEEGAYRVNALGARNVARASAAQGAKFVHVSTDYVFSGDRPGERTEDDPVCVWARRLLSWSGRNCSPL